MKETIPNGPQAISLDIGFSKFNHVYGIPERINSFEVKSTIEYRLESDKSYTKLNENEPFRLFAIDHFDDNYPNHS